jgi:hypothetical protein
VRQEGERNWRGVVEGRRLDLAEERKHGDDDEVTAKKTAVPMGKSPRISAPIQWSVDAVVSGVLDALHLTVTEIKWVNFTN